MSDENDENAELETVYVSSRPMVYVTRTSKPGP